MSDLRYRCIVVVSSAERPLIATEIEGTFPEPHDLDGEALVDKALQVARDDHGDL